ncbi:MarR family transcriptional regulator [Corynebacterium diphtheriae]|nr:MarR family transcriptional regulator [Corynebacterium diphtheriae]
MRLLRCWGKQWAHSIFADHHLEELNGEQKLITLINYLRHLGFDPEVEKTQDPTTSMLQLRTCPFGSMAHAPLSFVCRAHEGMLSAVEKTGGISFELTPLSAPHQCSIVAQLHGNEAIHRQRGEEHPHAGHR